MSFRGDRAIAATVGGYFTTSVNGIPTALLGTPSLNVFKRGSSTPSTAGVSLNVSVNSVVGLNSWVVDSSADGSFYVAGDFDVCIAAGTIGGSTAIGFVVDGFSLNSSVTSQVTGNVAGNVTGSVGSVVGAVGSVTGLTASNLDTTVSSRLAASSYTTPPTANANADALLDRADAIEVGLTPRQALRLADAALAGKVSGAATTTNTFRNAVADSKNRIVATVDSDGNRTAITYDTST